MSGDRWWRDNGPATIFPKPVPIPSAQIDDAPRYSLCINSEWMMYLLGCAKLLRRPETWQGTDAEIEDAITQAQGLFAMVQEECMSDIQFRTTDPCTLQVSTDGGDTWTTIYDGSACVNSIVSQPQTSSAIHANPPTVCKTYDIVVLANAPSTLPVTVNAGDTIRIVTPPTNIWSDFALGIIDNTSIYCGDGTVWDGPITGCGASEPAHEGDPLMSANHMRLILGLAGNFYDIMGSTFTVPVGVADAVPSLLANDGILYDNVGAQFVQVEVCRTGYIHVFDFTLSDGGWTAYAAGEAAYAPGTGWQGVYNGTSTTCIIKRTVPSATRITSIQAFATSDQDNSIGGCRGCNTDLNNVPSYCSTWPTGAGSFSPTTDMDAVNPGLIYMNWDKGNGTANTTISKVIVTGLGADPF